MFWVLVALVGLVGTIAGAATGNDAIGGGGLVLALLGMVMSVRTLIKR